MKEQIKVKRRRVKSSAILEIGFYKGSLEIMFHTGRVYKYSGVDVQDYEKLMASNSLGKAFNDLIRDRYIGVEVHV